MSRPGVAVVRPPRVQDVCPLKGTKERRKGSDERKEGGNGLEGKTVVNNILTALLEERRRAKARWRITVYLYHNLSNFFMYFNMIQNLSHGITFVLTRYYMF